MEITIPSALVSAMEIKAEDLMHWNLVTVLGERKLELTKIDSGVPGQAV